MKSKILETGKHTIIYGISSAFQSLIGFVLLPLLTKYYTSEEFGIYSLLILVSTLLGAFFFFGSTSTLNRYFFESESEIQKKSIVTTTFLITLTGALIQVLLGVLLATKLSVILTNSKSFSNHIFLIIVANAFGMLMNFNFVVLRLEKQSKDFVLVNIGSSLINIFLVYILLVKFKMGIYAPIIALLTANFLAFTFTFNKVRKYFTTTINKGNLKEYIFFGLSATLNGLTYYLLDWIDRYFIKEYSSLSDVGIYSMGYKIGMIIHVIMIIPFSMIWTTVRMQYAKDKDNSAFVTKIISYYTIIGLCVVFMTSLFAKELLTIFSGREEFIVAYKIVPIVMIAHLIYGYINIVDFGILISKKLHFFYITFLVAAILNAILNYFFIPKFGYIAAAYITLVTYIFCSVVIYLLGRKYYLIDIEYLRVFMPFIIVISILLLFSEMKLSLLNAIIFKILTVFISIYLTYNFWLTKHEKDIVNKNLLKS